MYYHIEKDLYIKLEVDQKLFNKALQKKVGEINIPYNDEWNKIVCQDNKFIRLTVQGSYIDLKINRISIGKKITVWMGEIIDFNRQKLKTYVNKLNNITCLASTIQEASSIFKVNLRHIKQKK